MAGKTKIAVIGAGISGLSCAYELSKQGFDVEVFEKEAYVGGRMATRFNGKWPFDMGAQMFANNYTATHYYCQELDLQQNWKKWTSNNTYVFRNSKLHLLKPFPPTDCLSQRLEILRLWLTVYRLSSRSKGMNLFELKDVQEIDPFQNAYDYSLQITSKEIIDYILDPIFYGNNFYSLPNLNVETFLSCARFAFHDVENYFHLNGCIGLLPIKLAEKLNVKVSTPIQKVQSTADGKVQIQIDDNIKVFDSVVFAIPASAIKNSYVNPSEAQEDLLSHVSYSATITLSLLVPASALDGISTGYVPLPESEIISSYVNQGNKGPRSTQDGKCLINFFLRDRYAKLLMNHTDQSIFDFVKAECIRVCPRLTPYAKQVENYDLKRWPQAIPLIPPGFISKVNQFWKKGQGENDVYFCGDFLASPYVEGSVRCGKRVAKEIITAFESRSV